MVEEAAQAGMVLGEPVAKAVQVGEAEEATFMSMTSDVHRILAESRTLRTFSVVWK